jgi:WD40 repeat protein
MLCLLCSGTSNGTVKLTNLTTHAVSAIRGHGYGVSVGLIAAAAADPTLAVSMLYGKVPGKGTTAVLWHVPTAAKLSSFVVDRPMWAAVISHDGRWLYGGGEELASEQSAAAAPAKGVIVVYNLQKGRAVGTGLRGHGLRIRSLAISHDSTLLLSASWDGSARLWVVGAHTGAQTATQTSAQANRAGYCLRSLCRNGATNDCIGSSNSSSSSAAASARGICSVAFARSSKWAITGCEDGAVYIWCTVSGRCLASLDDPSFTRAGAAVPMSVGGMQGELLALAKRNCIHVIDLDVLCAEAAERELSSKGLGDYLRCALRFALQS